MIKISRLADYATLILNHLALFPDRCWSAQQVASALQLPVPTASKCLKLLNEAELLLSSRGVHGGYRLARDAKHINLADVITAVDGDLSITLCSVQNHNCVLTSVCGLRHNWRLINQMMVSMLQQLSLAEMSLPLRKRVVVDNE